jgi:hypothetical protein
MQSSIEHKASDSIFRILKVLFYGANIIVYFENPASAAEIKQFRAAGTHVGDKCEVFGTGYTDCNVASRSLEARDCCPQTRKTVAGKPRFGGTTVGFSMKVCTLFDSNPNDSPSTRLTAPNMAVSELERTANLTGAPGRQS